MQTRTTPSRGRLLVLVATAVVVGALIALAIYVVADGPYWFRRTPGLTGDPQQARWLSQEIRGNRTAILAMIGGALAALGAFLTYQNLRVTRRSHQTDRFAKALEMLAADKPTLRLGGVYALHAIALESPREVQPVVNALRLHAHGDDSVSGEADRLAATDVADRLDPAEASLEILRSSRAQDIQLTTIALFGVAAAALLAIDPTLMPDGTIAIVTTVSAGIAAFLVAIPLARDRDQRVKLELQRPLFESELAHVIPSLSGAGYAVVRARDGAVLSTNHQTPELAAKEARIRFGLGPEDPIAVFDGAGNRTVSRSKDSQRAQ